MDRNINLKEGNITSVLMKLALPIMATSFIQMLYGLTDMMWLGRLSTNAVAAAGAVGFFMWIAMSLVIICQIGVSVGVSQAHGREDIKDAKEYISNGIKLNILIGLIYAGLLLLFRYQVIGFFKLDNAEAFSMAIEYLIIIALGLIFHFINPIFVAIFNASGNSVTPFKATSIGLVLNIVLDPLLIFGIGDFQGFGIKGAALATVIAQFIVTLIFLIITRKNKVLFSDLNIFSLLKREYVKKILKLGIPTSIQSLAHALISMGIARILHVWGPTALAVQSIGSQVESISWMTAEGFAQAIAAFTGQNYGARKFKRVEKGYFKGAQMAGTIGIFATFLLVFGGRFIFTIFTPEDSLAIEQGTAYLRILGFSQFLMTLEISSAAVFNGLGRTHIPASIGIALNALRIPMALILSGTILGINGVWWSISISTILKGLVLTVLVVYMFKKGDYKKI